MSDILATVSMLSAFALSVWALLCLVDGKFKALHATVLGISGFVLLDIGKYYYLDSKRIEWVGDDSFQSATLMIWLSCLLVFFSYFIFTKIIPLARKIPKIAEIRPSRKLLLNIIKVLLVPISIGAMVLSVYGGYFGIVASGLLKGLLVSYFIYGIYSNDKSAILISTICLFIGVNDASRRAYIAIFFPVILLLLLTFRERIGRIRFKWKLAIIFSLACAFVFLNALRSTHDYGEGFNPDSKIENTLTYITELKSVDTFYNTTYIYEKFSTEWDYYYGETYLSLFVSPIPRALWPDKPVSLGSQLGLMQRLNYRGFDQATWESINMFSLSPGFVGEAFANFGYFGVILMSLLLGFAAAYYDRRLIGLNPNVMATPWLMYISSFILLHRGDFYVSLNFQTFMFIAAFVFFNAFYRERKIAAGPPSA